MRDGWVETTLGEVAAIGGSKTDPSRVNPDCPYVGLEHVASGEPRVREAGRAGDMSSLVSQFDVGDTLFGRLRPYLRKVALADFRGVCSSEILVLTPDTARVAPAFLHLLASSESTIETCISKSAGSRMPRTSAADLLAVGISLPPLAEQRRIVDLITAVDQSIAAAESVARRSRVAHAVLLATALDTGCEPRRLGDLCLVKGGKRLPRGTPWAESPTDHRYIRATDIRDGQIQEHELVYVPDHVWPTIARYVVETDDVLITIAGTVGNTAQVPAHLAGANLTENAAVLRVVSPDLVPAFLAEWLTSEDAQAQILSRTVGTTQKKLALFRIEALDIVVPPVAQQRETVEVLAAVTDTSRKAEACCSYLQTGREALLADLLSGNHEIPASYDALLEAAA